MAAHTCQLECAQQEDLARRYLTTLTIKKKLWQTIDCMHEHSSVRVYMLRDKKKKA